MQFTTIDNLGKKVFSTEMNGANKVTIVMLLQVMVMDQRGDGGTGSWDEQEPPAAKVSEQVTEGPGEVAKLKTMLTQRDDEISIL